jgi:4-aminobutyrate aminotransferase/(S)-3-amino-2-methylpropionate transaminase
VIVEPVQGRAGARIPPEGFMAEVSRLASEAGALVVADEVLTGMGRCGPLLASELVGLRPDVVCLGKALGAGLQVSACMARADVMDAWPKSGGEAIHTSTFLGHPLSCAAALAALEQSPPEPRRVAVQERGSRILEALRQRLSSAPGVGDVRGAGLLLAIELIERNGAAPAEGAAVRVASSALREGLLVLPAGEHGHVVELTPALVVTDEQIDFAVEVLVKAIEGLS